MLPAIQAVDDRIRQLLADNSEAWFGMKCTLDMVAKCKFYTPLAYSEEDTHLPPLAGGTPEAKTAFLPRQQSR